MAAVICSIFFKYTSLTETEDIQNKMSREQQDDYIVSQLAVSAVLVASVLGSLVVVALIAIVQAIVEARKRAALRRLKYVKTGKWVEMPQLDDPQAFHLFLSHAWPAAQDRMRSITAGPRIALISRMLLSRRSCPCGHSHQGALRRGDALVPRLPRR